MRITRDRPLATPRPPTPGPCLGSVGATLTAPDSEVTRLPQLLQAATRLARPPPPPVTLRHSPARPLAQEPLPFPGTAWTPWTCAPWPYRPAAARLLLPSTPEELISQRLAYGH